MGPGPGQAWSRATSAGEVTEEPGMSAEPRITAGTIAAADVAPILADLVALPSVNPLNRASFESPYGEAGVADYVERFARSLGLPVERQAVLPGRDNVLAYLDGADRGRRLLLECHMDTVPGWEASPGPFEPRVVDGCLYGRGACDVKGTLAAMLAALRLLVHRGWRPPRTLILAATVDEEHQARGVTRLAREVIGVESAVVGEPTRLAVTIAHKGCVRWRVTTRGRSVHSSKAELGSNAIDQMVDLLAGFRAELLPALAERSHPLVGRPTLSVCTIHGGVAVNVIPDACTIEIDRRTIPGEASDEVDRAFRQAVERIAAGKPGLQVEVEPPFVTEEALGTPEDAPIVGALRRASTAIIGRSEVIGVPFGTDASELSQAGIPSVVFGPGDIDLAHTTDEHIALDEVARAAEIFATLALL
jgi:succinyl-diaminopimelate desuccinylase